MIRLRQAALVARNLDAAIADIRQHLDVDVCFRDPGVAEFGLHNALFRVGDQFLEVVSPVTTGTTAGRLLDKMGGDCGYMAIFEVDDLDARMRHLTKLGVRTVWQGDFRQIRGRHLHPKDTGGTLVSIDQPELPGEWHWAGPNWRDSRRSTIASAITGITLASADPVRLRERWQGLDIDTDTNYVSDDADAERLSALTLKATNDADRGRRFTICGVDFTLV
jgi:Glyoxalase-like domain